ncbi:hypothetical protein CYMTET_5026 [Cymbomonas tetramitiformis]|uniref:Uncharacterized protein n=1 Tax=Cymbomonas tetramitiformis TaxID=36881 RepID=A0AAE0H087_9CHLO|nr:hypothetical protein CYMTET_5026 [Cymbomonas tetramitiformis]
MRLQTSASQLLPSLLTNVIGIFEAYHHPSCLDVLATAAEVFAGGGAGQVTPESGQMQLKDAAASAALQEALGRVCFAAYTKLQSGAMASFPELLKSLFDMCHKYICFAPEIILQLPSLPTLIQISTQSIRLRERDPILTTIAFLSTLLAPGEKALQLPVWQQFRCQVDACIGQHGEELTRACLMAVADTCPSQLVSKLGGVIMSLLQSYPQPAQQWFGKVLMNPQFPGEELVLTEEDRQRVCAIAMSQPALPVRQFQSFISAFGSVCRREANSDVLIGFQMS